MELINTISQISLKEQVKYQSGIFPKSYGPAGIDSFPNLSEYFRINHQKIVAEVNQHGALFFRGFDIKNANQFASILNKLGKKPFQYIGGAAVRKLIIGNTQKNNQAKIQVFTTNESPQNQPIPLHNQLLQNQNYPDYVSFYCLSQAETGGSTPIINCHELYKHIAKTYPQFLQQIQQKKIRYIRVVGAQDNPKSPIGRGWKNIFKVETKEQAGLKIINAGYQFEWLENDYCRLISKKLPAITTSKSGLKVFCNQMIAVFQGWIDQRNNPKQCLKLGDYQNINQKIMTAICEYADKNKISIPWKKGDFIIIDNQMVAHSREPFTGNNRKILASLFKGERKISNQPHLTLTNGDQMPMLGFGTWKINKENCKSVVYNAIKSGYRLLDCACDYGNQQQVGQAIKQAISDKIVTREQLFITSKLWNTFHRPQHVREACMKTLKDLQLQYVDLYLIHFPISLKYVPITTRYPPQWIHDPKAKTPCMEEDHVSILDTWRQMEKLFQQKLVRNIGVSNFSTVLLRDLLNSSTIKPSVLQVQIHPYLTQKKLIKFCRLNGIAMTSYSTIGASSYLELNAATQQQLISKNKVILNIAQKHKKSPYQIVLRWAFQQGLATIPKTINQDRMKQNRNLLDWTLTQQQMNEIDQLNRNRRYNDPGVFCQLAFGTFFPIYD